MGQTGIYFLFTETSECVTSVSVGSEEGTWHCGTSVSGRRKLAVASARDGWAGGPLHPEKRLAPHQGSLALALDWPSCKVLEPWHPQALAKKPLSLTCDSCRFGKNVPASVLWFTQLAVSEVGRTDLSLGDS